MLDFSGADEPARAVALYYAKQFNDELMIALIGNRRGVDNADEARRFSEFFWRMLDAAVADAQAGKSLKDEGQAQFWMERLMNIMHGYISREGYEAVWDAVSDKA